MSPEHHKMAIAEFLVAEHKRLTGYVRRLIDDAADRDGEDIVQDVALSLFDRADVLMPIEVLSAYVYRSLRNRVTDHLRRRRQTVSLDDPAEEEEEFSLIREIADDVANVEEEAVRGELRRSLIAAIDGLPDDQKAVVIETELNGRSYRDLSEEWGIPLGTLLARKSRAITKVRESLRDFRPEKRRHL
jgi:RNA polymerase sigma factor (sigma-70 family)